MTAVCELSHPNWSRSAGTYEHRDLITYADIESVEGSAGNFKVRVKRRARSVNTDLCTGCGICVENCPVTNQPLTTLGE